jgi:hypothetical protein
MISGYVGHAPDRETEISVVERKLKSLLKEKLKSLKENWTKRTSQARLTHSHYSENFDKLPGGISNVFLKSVVWCINERDKQ